MTPFPHVIVFAADDHVEAHVICHDRAQLTHVLDSNYDVDKIRSAIAPWRTPGWDYRESISTEAFSLRIKCPASGGTSGEIAKLVARALWDAGVWCLLAVSRHHALQPAPVEVW